jgi:ATP-binding cassette subfamily B protein
VAAGERVALVGPSGSGTSTATLLVPRCYDVRSGAVLVDGQDVRDLALGSLRSRVGIVFEESFLFSDTVRANIAYGRPDATDEQVLAAARVAQADGFVRDLPAGYDTVVGERGLTLSGGQRQRIALARAVLHDPQVLLLDEPRANLDPKAAEQLEPLIGRPSGRTRVLVSHDVERSLAEADLALGLRAGRQEFAGRADAAQVRSLYS